MSEGDVKSLIKELQIAPENLPKIFSTDPQAVKIGAKPGQIIKIHRKEGQLSYFYYRVVVEE
ncbi:MAG: DNA-directed RNA polymerase subunit H [Candidatus Micrarchaeota archaeon]|nr:DNA-directed RNA polymerase subunit H [Candidatus Micrarchaeota archaeon]